ncbi:alkaline phosphatase D family protein [Phycisphaeraceae bacterium D3-23]
MAGRTRRDGRLHLVVPIEDAAEPERTRITFGSCADMDLATQATFYSIIEQDPDVLVLLGDTPYIDSTDPERQRERYAEFAAGIGFVDARGSFPIYGTWDDHDFGRNDTDGNLDGKENSRAAFIAHYEPLGNATFGNGEEGVYTSFVVGNVEVFLLDTRYFAATEPSPFDADTPTLLGEGQWDWLRAGLSASEADFKVLACGMIWNGAVRPGKPDHWASYPHEYDGLMQFIGDEQIAGVVLVGGDIHRSRCIEHDTADAAGYVIREFITSPMHHRIIDTANQPHDGLVFDAGVPHSFLLLETDMTEQGEPLLLARFLSAARNLAGEPETVEHFRVGLPLGSLSGDAE